MTFGVIEHEKLDDKMAADAGFDFVEKAEQTVPLVGMTAESLVDAIKNAAEKSYEYIVISTVGNCSIFELKTVIERVADDIKKHQVAILIENGMAGSDKDGYVYNDFSDTGRIREIAEYGDDLCGVGMFGICVNVGYANLLARSVRLVIEGAGDYIGLVHVNDNDGFINEKQMPYTYTRGRGDQTTDWYRIIGSLIRACYDGMLVFDTEGLFNRTPKIIVPAMLKMLRSIGGYWDSIIHFEDILNCGKKIILFGAGRMSSNYMYIWGDRYSPLFLVDNDSKKWGKKHCGVDVKSPNEILNVPENERLVLLCNARYEEIGLQLRKMNVEYIKYDDNYYDFVMQ